MIIEVYVGNHINDHNLAACGMVLIVRDKFGHQKKRTMGFPLGSSPQRMADVQMIRLALTAIRSIHRRNPVHLYTPTEIMGTLNTADKLEASLGLLIRSFPQLYSAVDPNHGLVVESSQLAASVSESQHLSDSGTIDV